MHATASGREPHTPWHAGKPALPDNFEEVTWAKLQDAVNAVHEKRKVATSLEELYMVGGILPVVRPHTLVEAFFAGQE